MDQRLIDIGVRRGRLIERIASQRALLGQQMQPVHSILNATDRGLAGVRTGFAYLRQHPGIVVAAIVLLAVVKPRRAWRWARRSLIAWQTWRSLSARLAAFRLRPHG